MYCHARKCDINVSGSTPTGWPTGRKPGARGRAGLIVHGELLTDIQMASVDRTKTAEIAEKYGVSATTISNLAVVLGFAQRKSRKTSKERVQILSRVYENLSAIAKSIQGCPDKKQLHTKVVEIRTKVYTAIRTKRPLTKAEIQAVRELTATNQEKTTLSVAEK